MKDSVIKKAKLISLLSVLSLSLLLQSPNVRAAEIVRMIAVDSYSSSSLWVKVFIEYFIPEVDKRLAEKDNYEIDWNPAFGGTIAKTKGVLDSLQHDLGDIGIITTPYHADKLPFYNLPYSTPFVTSDIGLIARSMSDLHDKYPELKEGWDEYGIHYLVTAGNIDSYGLLMTDPIESFADLSGKKIGGVGSNLTFLEGSGAARVSSGLSDWYNNMATGLLDGIIVWPEAVLAYRLFEVAPYMLDIKFGGATSKAVVFNKKRWDRLPEEIQIVLQEVAIDYRDELSRVTDEISAHAREEFVKNGGTIIPVTTEQRQEWASKLDDLGGLWLGLMDKKGLPGGKILADYMQIMRDNDQQIMRQWGSE